MKLCVITLGCRTNQAESQNIETAALNSGYKLVDINDNPDVCVINTCTVTAKADQESRSLIRKAMQKSGRIIATGCYTEINKQIDGLKNEKLTFVSNADKDNITRLLGQESSSVKSKDISKYRIRPNVKVQAGCNFSCSYCSIPVARGASISVPIDNVLNEIANYNSMGFNEIVLTGTHLGSYGLDMHPKESLSKLLSTILKKTSISRVRLSSIEVNEVNEELTEFLGEDRVCKHLHIPLQSGDDNTLKNMNRCYNSKKYLNTVSRLLKRFDDLALGTDIIAGFPTENQQAFQNSVDFIEPIGFSYLHAFSYSVRTGTKAALIKQQNSNSTIKERVRVLRNIGDKKRESFIKNNLGRVFSVVIEDISSEYSYGTTHNNIKVKLSNCNKAHIGAMVDARLTEYSAGIALGIPA
ncbi:MAG: tRNA (N(6)-L-threonylcarbamoyladenosine(37)-C(2))-methylthiotransferase MtaB [Nitrospirae bacterium]|nr:MAG: tRNA (N(6)-L-threonylcarbamoyladenosine(37)-C(2))-methylthiotransferase MtaB [Nitrospirota bacterium]